MSKPKSTRKRLTAAQKKRAQRKRSSKSSASNSRKPAEPVPSTSESSPAGVASAEPGGALASVEANVTNSPTKNPQESDRPEASKENSRPGADGRETREATDGKNRSSRNSDAESSDTGLAKQQALDAPEEKRSDAEPNRPAQNRKSESESQNSSAKPRSKPNRKSRSSRSRNSNENRKQKKKKPLPYAELDKKAWQKKAWKLFAAEFAEEGLELVEIQSGKEVAERCFDLAESFLRVQDHKLEQLKKSRSEKKQQKADGAKKSNRGANTTEASTANHARSRKETQRNAREESDRAASNPTSAAGPAVDVDAIPNPSPEELAALPRQLEFFRTENPSPRFMEQEHIDFYNAEGYLMPFEGLSQEEVSNLRLFFDGVLADFAAQGRDSYSISTAHLRFKPVYDLVAHPAIVGPVCDLLGPDVVAWGAHFFCKLPHDGKRVPWHQDSTYWPISPTKTVTVWLAIDDADPKNANMQFIPKSHLHGIVDYEVSRDDADVLKMVIDNPEQYGDAPVDATLRAGQFSMHSDLLLHGSEANESDRRRCGLTIRYAAAEVQAWYGWNEKGVVVAGEDRTGNWRNHSFPSA